MRRIELIAMTTPKLPWTRLVEELPPSLEQVGLAPDESSKDGEITMQDHGDAGCVVLLDSGALAKRIAVALAKRSGAAVTVFEVVGSAGEKRNRFRTTAVRAEPSGELKPYEGKELDLEDEQQTWGGGGLVAQANRVLQEYAQLDLTSLQEVTVGYRKKPRGKPSSPRIATILKSLQKAKRYEGVTQPDGRVELKIELAAGGKQTSFCTAEEFAELERLVGA